MVEFTTAELFQIATGASSVLIALCALIIAIYEGRLARKHQRLMLQPDLHCHLHTSELPALLSCTLKNLGLGPAHLQAFSVFHDNERIPGLPLEALSTAIQCCLGQLRVKNLQINAVSPGYLMKPDETQLLWSIELFKDGSSTLNQLQDAIAPLNIRLEYESLVKETFKYDMEYLKSYQEKTNLHAQRMKHERS